MSVVSELLAALPVEIAGSITIRSKTVPPAPDQIPPSPTPAPIPDGIAATAMDQALLMLGAPGGFWYREKASPLLSTPWQYSVQLALPGPTWTPLSGVGDIPLTPIGGFGYPSCRMEWDGGWLCEQTGDYGVRATGRGQFNASIGGVTIADETSTDNIQHTQTVHFEAGKYYGVSAGLATGATDKVTMLSVQIQPPGGDWGPLPSTHCYPLATMTPPVLPTPPAPLPVTDFSTYRSPALPPDYKFFGDGYEWNRNISQDEVDPNSDRIIAGLNGARLHHDFDNQGAGIPFNDVTDAATTMVDVNFTGAKDQSDLGPYMMPWMNAVFEKDTDKHLIVLNRDAGELHELYSVSRGNDAAWNAYSGVKWKLGQPPNRQPGNTSADASGDAMLPGMIRPEEVFRDKRINHAIRFIVSTSRICAARVAPANHIVFDKGPMDGSGIPMGCRFRLKKTPEVQAVIAGLPPDDQVICVGMQEFGLIVADGTTATTEAFFGGVPDNRWVVAVLALIKERLNTNHLEVVKMPPLVTSA